MNRVLSTLLLGFILLIGAGVLVAREISKIRIPV